MQIVKVYRTVRDPESRMPDLELIGDAVFHGFGIGWQTLPCGTIMQRTVAIIESADGEVRTTPLNLIRFNGDNFTRIE
jgi:hypothetical protein